jgi:hypothetical protein
MLDSFAQCSLIMMIAFCREVHGKSTALPFSHLTALLQGFSTVRDPSIQQRANKLRPDKKREKLEAVNTGTFACDKHC